MASAELLKQIQAGKGLKKTVTNDRSKPLIDAKPNGGGGTITGGGGSSAAAIAGAGAPQLGGLFVGGIPKLKPPGQGKSIQYNRLGLDIDRYFRSETASHPRQTSFDS